MIPSLEGDPTSPEDPIPQPPLMFQKELTGGEGRDESKVKAEGLTCWQRHLEGDKETQRIALGCFSIGTGGVEDSRV